MPLTRERVWISLKIWGLKTKFIAVKAVALTGIGLALFGSYVIIQPGVSVPIRSTLVDSLPIVQGLTTVDGVLILVAGMVLVAASTRT